MGTQLGKCMRIHRIVACYRAISRHSPPQLPEDGGPLTPEWMQERLDQLQAERSRVTTDKKTNNTKLAKKKESVLSELEKLRTLNRAHRKLMVEIWPQLTALARVRGSSASPYFCICSTILRALRNRSS